MDHHHKGESDTWTIGRLLTSATTYLADRDIDEPRLSSELLLSHALGCSRIQLYTRFDDPVDDAQRSGFRDLVRRAADHTPIAYLVGRKEFFSLTFEVSPDVLIPRPETETLVAQAIEACRKRPQNGEQAVGPVQLLDVGCGSGCILIAVLKHLPQAVGVATDISPAALAIAQRNAEHHGVRDRIQFVEADALRLPTECIPEGGLDLLLCNPPYVAEGDLAELPPNVREHEPRVALTPGGDGLGFFRQLAERAGAVLRPGGGLIVEIGAGQGGQVRAIMTEGGQFRHLGTFSTPPDPHERVMHFAKS